MKKTYYIYHIPGVKIGCTSEPEKRISDQGYSDYEILEQHEDIYVASDRERELQKQYGYKVDISPYWLSIENRSKISKEAEISGGRLGGLKRSEVKTAANKLNSKLAGKKSASIIRTCECGRSIKSNIGFFTHIKKCPYSNHTKSPR